MKSAVFFLFFVTSSFAQFRSYPYEEIRTPSVKHSREVESLVDPLETQTYEKVESSKLVCCVTKSVENNEDSTPSNNPSLPRLVQYPTNFNRLDQSRKDLIIKNLANIFRRVLTETILKIARSLLGTFEEPMSYSQPPQHNYSQANNDVPHDSALQQIKQFLQNLNIRQPTGNFHAEQPLFQQSNQRELNSQQLRDNNCEVVPINEC